MFGLFSKSKVSTVAVASNAAEAPFFFPKKKQSIESIIEEIHESFYTEVDKLLAEANISKSLDTDKQSLIDKCLRLKSLGFTNTKEVIEAEKEIVRLDDLKRENESKKQLIEAINYFSMKYPNYKFITEESVQKICKKYGLVYGEVNKYIGTVPDKNLKHIEGFRIEERDELYLVSMYGGRKRRSVLNKLDIKYYSNSNDHILIVSPLEIAAPIKDFNMEGQKVENYKISKMDIPDPVVLKPVHFGTKKYYLIVTAWGLEASDELVVNERMN